MLKTIRSFNIGWMAILTGIIFIASGISKTSGRVSRTLLCFDEGCIYIQGVTNFVLGLLFIVIGLYFILTKKSLRQTEEQ